MSLLGGSALTWAISFHLGVVPALGGGLLPVLFHQAVGHFGDSFAEIKVVVPAGRRRHQGQWCRTPSFSGHVLHLPSWAGQVDR